VEKQSSATPLSRFSTLFWRSLETYGVSFGYLKLQAANSGPPTPLPNTQPNIYNGMFSDKVLS
jgi:hypothetical protein